MTERKKLKLPDVGKPLAPPAPLVRRAGRTDDGRDVVKARSHDATHPPTKRRAGRPLTEHERNSYVDPRKG